MTHRILSPLLVLALAAGCTNRDDSVPEEPPKAPPVAEAQGSDGPTVTEDDGETIADTSTSSARRVLKFQGEPRRVPEELTPEQRARVDKVLSEMGEVKLLLDDPVTTDPLLPGRYLLSISILLANGSPTKTQHPCRVEVDGTNFRILLENTNVDPILATIENGEILSEPREGPGTYGLEGRMVGPGKARGAVIPGPVPHPRNEIIEGRWGLDALPLKTAQKSADEGTGKKDG